MFGNKYEKMGRTLADWASGEWLIPRYKKIIEPYGLSNVEYIRFLFGVPFLHLSICTWTVNLTFSNKNYTKQILDSMLERHLHNQEKLKGTASIDKIVVYEPEIDYLRELFDIKPNTSTSWKTLTELLFEYRQSEYLKSLASGFSDKSRMNNPVGLGPTKPLAVCFGNHIKISNESEISTILPLSLLETSNEILAFCRKRV